MTLGHKHGRGHASAHAHTLVPLLLVKPLTGGILLHELSLDMRGLSGVLRSLLSLMLLAHGVVQGLCCVL